MLGLRERMEEMVPPLDPGRPSEARQPSRTRRSWISRSAVGSLRRTSCGSSKKRTAARSPQRSADSYGAKACTVAPDDMAQGGALRVPESAVEETRP